MKYFTAITLALVLLFGGGALQGRVSDALAELVALPLLAVILIAFVGGSSRKCPRLAFLLAGSVFALPALQLVPLPPFIWSSLPGRDLIASSFRDASIPLPWLPISLNPNATWMSFLSLLPPASIFFATIESGDRTRQILALMALGFGLFNVLLGFAQLAGISSNLYDSAASGDVSGVFANHNHYAAMLAALVPLLAAQATLSSGDTKKLNSNIVLITIYMAMLVGISLSRSRFSLVLAIVAGVASIVILRRQNADAFGRARSGRGILVALTGIGLLLVFQFGFSTYVSRFESTSILGDLRWPISLTSLRSAAAVLPFGGGFGSFDGVYKLYETSTTLKPEYINHAHDDWLEAVVDAGFLIALPLTLALLWLYHSFKQTWTNLSEGKRSSKTLAPAALPVIGIIALSAMADYPLHTITMMTILALAMGLAMPAPIEASPRRRTSENRYSI